MDPNIIPTPHPDPWVNLLGPYVTEAVRALAANGVHVQQSWLDPRGPRDATILFSNSGEHSMSSDVLALIWDEETGWRRGRFIDGAQGRRTILTQVAYLGGGLLPPTNELAHRITGRIIGERSEAQRKYRSCEDNLRDGLDDALRMGAGERGRRPSAP